MDRLLCERFLPRLRRRVQAWVRPQSRRIGSFPLLAFSPEAAKAVVERTSVVAWPGGARDRRGKPDQLPGVAVGGGECPEREGSADGQKVALPRRLGALAGRTQR
jgi:hypothetical protein